MAEWSKAADCKSVRKSHIGSNPIFLTLKFLRIERHINNHINKIKRFRLLQPKIIIYKKKIRKYPLNKLRIFNLKYKPEFKNNSIYFYYKGYILNYFHFHYFTKKHKLEVGTYTERKRMNKVFRIRTLRKLLNHLYKFYTNMGCLCAQSSKHFRWFENCWGFFLLKTIKSYTLDLIGPKVVKISITRVLNLNFKRKRFFPVIRTLCGLTFFTISLGILAKYIKKGKSFTKKKANFLLVAGFLRKILLYSSLYNLMLMIRRTPMFLQEILSLINNPISNLYKHPFSSKQVNELKEFKLGNPFNFSRVVFTTTKAYGPVKVKNKGRLKRKITKKLNIIGRVTD